VFLIDETPLDWNFTLLLGADLFKGCNRKVDRVLGQAGRAIIYNSYGDSLAIVGVSYDNLLAAETGLLTTVAITLLIYGSNEVLVRVYCTASACITLLIEEGRNSACEYLDCGSYAAGKGRRCRFDRRGWLLSGRGGRLMCRRMGSRS